MSLSIGLPVPFEILQAILLALDFESFYFASLTCSLWRSASSSTAILRQQLLTVPALAESADLLRDATPQDIRALYRRVCRENLIGFRQSIEYTDTVASKDNSARIGEIPVRSPNGVFSAQLHGMTLILDTPSGLTTCKTREIQLSPTLYPTPDTVKQIASHAQMRTFFRARSFARMQVAMPQCGSLVAVALGRKVHIYALKSEKQQHVEVEATESVLDSIQSIEFTDDDELLRCEIDGVEGRYVRYLGHRRCRCHQPRKIRGSKPVISPGQRLRYWLAALRNVYLDSADVERRLEGGVSLRGMRVVKAPLRRGEECTCRTTKYFLALLREGSCEGRYVVGRASGDEIVEIVQQIPTRRVSTYPGTVNETTGAREKSLSMQLDRWDSRNLPMAHSPDPLLRVCDDGKILAVFEPPHGQSQGAIYICSVESSSPDGDSLESSVAWPFVLCALDTELDSLDVSIDDDKGGYVVSAQSQEQVMQWRLRPMMV
ncbi:hypothetical protein BJX66DRAFT_311810 [Aspergillus keveii]|uniref:F-box domain protein n=1 Tax=Aspergillus keveii TaxID=714993 RepID=A0ABR4FUS3_9EURO